MRGASGRAEGERERVRRRTAWTSGLSLNSSMAAVITRSTRSWTGGSARYSADSVASAARSESACFSTNARRRWATWAESAASAASRCLSALTRRPQGSARSAARQEKAAAWSEPFCGWSAAESRQSS